MDNALIIFVRNTEPGKVKTRLAKDIGDDKALSVYKYLLQYMRNITLPLHCNRFVFYSNYIHTSDIFDDHDFSKHLQEGDELGERMMKAIEKVFDLGCKKVCIIGSDCYDLDTETLEEAFSELDKNDVVIGPSKDGGYYLLGLKKINVDLFTNKQWGTSTVMDDTLENLETLGLSYITLKQLNDIDTAEDLLSTDILTRLEEET